MRFFAGDDMNFHSANQKTGCSSILNEDVVMDEVDENDVLTFDFQMGLSCLAKAPCESRLPKGTCAPKGRPWLIDPAFLIGKIEGWNLRIPENISG